MTAPLRLPVFVEEWQIECCGTPPGIGDRVEWTLVLAAGDRSSGPDPEADVRLLVLARPWTAVEEGRRRRVRVTTRPTLIEDRGLRAFWPAGPPASGPVEVTGRLLEDHHGSTPDGFPPTVGTVVRVRVATQEFAPHPTEARTYVRDGVPDYRDVRRCPDHFTSGATGGGGPYRAEVGVLVDLLVRDEPPTGAPARFR